MKLLLNPRIVTLFALLLTLPATVFAVSGTAASSERELSRVEIRHFITTELAKLSFECSHKEYFQSPTHLGFLSAEGVVKGIHYSKDVWYSNSERGESYVVNVRYESGSTVQYFLDCTVIDKDSEGRSTWVSNLSKVEVVYE